MRSSLPLQSGYSHDSHTVFADEIPMAIELDLGPKDSMTFWAWLLTQ